MHASLRVCRVRVAGTVVIVVLGLGFGGWPPAEAVHEPAGVVPVHPRGGDLLKVGPVAGLAGPVPVTVPYRA